MIDGLRNIQDHKLKMYVQCVHETRIYVELINETRKRMCCLDQDANRLLME